MDLTLRVLLLSIWALLIVLKQGITLLIDMVECHVFDEAEQPLNELPGHAIREGVMLLPPLSYELVLVRFGLALIRD